jgi:hypothetical protein
MAYLGDIRENSISPEGIIWENDNRKDARYYWNGAFIDLCDLPGEDYAKTIFVTSGSGSNEPSTPSKTTNVITVQLLTYVNENNEEVWAYNAMAKQPVASDMLVELKVRDANGNEENIQLRINNGGTMSETYSTNMLSSMPQPEIIMSNYSPKEDEEFKYNTTLPEKAPELPMAYTLTLKKGEVDTLTNDELLLKLKNSEKVSMSDETKSEYFKPKFEAIAVPNLSTMTIKERKEALKANSQDIIIVTDKEIVSIEQAGVEGINELNAWNKREDTLTIEGVEFTVWLKRTEDVGQSYIYDPETKEVVNAQVLEYIIYYE